MKGEESFLEKLRKKPKDQATRLIFADWLEERGEIHRAGWLRDPEYASWMAPEWKHPAPALAKAFRERQESEKAKALSMGLGPDAVVGLLPELSLDALYDEAHREEVRKMLVEMARTDKQLATLEKQLWSDKWRDQLQAVEALGELGEVGALLLGELILLSQNLTKDIYKEIVDAIAKMGRFANVGLRVLWDDAGSGDYPPHHSLFDAIVRQGPESELVPLLVGGLHNGSDTGEDAKRALLNLGLHVALLIIDEHWTDNGELCWFSETLADMAPDVIPLLLERCQSPKTDRYQRQELIRTLGQIAEEDRLGEHKETVVEQFIASLDDKHIQSTAAWCLKVCGADAAPAIPGLLRMLDSKNPETQQAAVEALTGIGAEAHVAIPEVEALSKSKSPQVRKAAAEFLFVMGHDDTPQELLAGLQSPDERKRNSTLISLEGLKKSSPQKALELLMKAVETEDVEVRRFITNNVLSWFTLQEVSMLEFLRKAWADPDKEVRLCVFQHGVAGYSRTPEELLPDLLRLLKTDPSAEVRDYAVRSFRHFKPTAKLLKAVRDALNDQVRRVRQEAVDTLAHWEKLSEDVIPHLIEGLESPGTEEARRTAKRCLKLKDPPPEIYDALRTAWRKSEGAGHIVFAGTLNQLGYQWQPDDVALLVKHLQHDTGSSAEFAATVLGQLSNAPVPELESLVAKANEWLRNISGSFDLEAKHEEYRRQLQRIALLAVAGCQIETIEPFRQFLTCRYLYVVADTLKTLQKMGATGTIFLPELLNLIGEHDYPVDQPLTDAIIELSKHSSTVLDRLIKSLRSKDTRQVCGVAKIIAKLGPETTRATTALVKLLSHSNNAVRAEAARTLGEIGSPAKRAIPQLIEMVKDEDVEPRSAAISALGKMGGHARKALPVLREHLESKDRETEHATRKAIEQIEGTSDAQD